jgi:uncharacterized membrane protein
MKRLSLLLFLALIPVSTFFVLNGIGGMPDRIAIHFDVSGSADAWTDRGLYRLFILLSLVGLPLLLVWLMAGLPRRTNGKGQVPNSEYWFAQERRQSTEAFLLAHACWLGCLTVAVVYGIHVFILRANSNDPPELDSGRFITMLIVYLCGLLWWMVTFIRHFQRVEKDNRSQQ